MTCGTAVSLEREPGEGGGWRKALVLGIRLFATFALWGVHLQGLLTTTMILSFLSFPSPPFALCTVFGEPHLPCPVISRCPSLSPCPVSSWPSLFFLPWGALDGGGVCCCGEGVEEAVGEGEWEWGFAAPFPLLPLEEEDPGSRGLLVGVGGLGVGSFAHLLLLAHIFQSVLGVVACCLTA